MSRAARRPLLAVLLCSAALLAPAAARAAWLQPVGGENPINAEAQKDAAEASIGEFSGVPYVAWEEEDTGGGHVWAARLNDSGNEWERPGEAASPISGSGDAEDPTLRRGDPGGPPCVAFDEAATPTGTRIHMVCMTSEAHWETVGDSPDKDPEAFASEPSLTIFKGISWVAWSETDSHGVNQIRVAKLPAPGTSWERVPDTESPINVEAGAQAHHPSLVAAEGDLYVAWSEINSAGVSQIHVARLNAAETAWEKIGGPLNRDPGRDAVDPSMTAVGGTPYVAWSETDGLGFEQVRVARLSAGGGWEMIPDTESPVNENPEEDAEEPSITTIGGVPYIAWSEHEGTNKQIRVARLNQVGPPTWEKVADSSSPINNSPQREATGPSLTEIGGIPWVGWSEVNAEDVKQTRATRLVPEFLGAEATNLSLTGATLESKILTYGLPFPIGFEYGKVPGEHQTPPVAAPAGQEEPTIAQAVSGLSPKTRYQARPFATAGVPMPRLTGSSFDFATPSPTKNLTVTLAGSGTGTVSSVPAGIACGSSCEARFEEGATVTLDAIAAPGSTFVGWSGGCTGSGACRVMLGDDTTVTASFEPSPPGQTGGTATGEPAPPPAAPTPPAPPQAPRGTKILGARINSAKGSATFRFKALGAGAPGFRCALRRGSKRARFQRCRSPRVYRNLKPGRYAFEVQAVGAGGTPARPAVRRFRIGG